MKKTFWMSSSKELITTNWKLVYQKPTSTHIYINWNAHAPTKWKIGTLTNLIKREKLICSDKSLVNEGMECLTKVLHEVNC